MIVQFNDIMRSFNALAGSAPKPVTGCLVDVENGSRLEFCFNPGEIDDDIPVNSAIPQPIVEIVLLDTQNAKK